MVARLMATVTRARRLVLFLVMLALSLPVGTLCHELVGHGLTGVLCGGRIAYIEVLGVSFWPQVRWVGWQGGYGRANIEGVGSATGEWLVSLNGSMSTWLVAVVAVALLWMRTWSTTARLTLICLGLWWIDLFTYTLPTFGIRRSIFWGGMRSEPYEAAVALGVPGLLFQTFVVSTSVILAVTLVVACRRKPTKKQVELSKA